ncbi:Der GTPase-activating protein YihI [Orbaceae bacterium ESL0721]|nr:Der GTPase-activating protein YihI [Orbaceae bacterium ESL0721]
MLKKRVKKSRQEINDASWELKRKRKHKGLPSGSRFNTDDNSRSQSSAKAVLDPRVGSKKPIALVATKPVTSKPVTTNVTPVPNKSTSAPKPKLTPEEELSQLESDPQLDSLLDLVEQGGELTAEQQTYLDSKLDRIDILMKQLGYDEDGADDQEEIKEDIVSLLKLK